MRRFIFLFIFSLIFCEVPVFSEAYTFLYKPALKDEIEETMDISVNSSVSADVLSLCINSPVVNSPVAISLPAPAEAKPSVPSQTVSSKKASRWLSDLEDADTSDRDKVEAVIGLATYLADVGEGFNNAGGASRYLDIARSLSEYLPGMMDLFGFSSAKKESFAGYLGKAVLNMIDKTGEYAFSDYDSNDNKVVFPSVIEILLDLGTVGREKLAQIAPQIVERFKSSNPKTRCSAVAAVNKIFSRLTDKSLKNALASKISESLNDEDGIVRSLAERVNKKIAGSVNKVTVASAITARNSLAQQATTVPAVNNPSSVFAQFRSFFKSPKAVSAVKLSSLARENKLSNAEYESVKNSCLEMLQDKKQTLSIKHLVGRCLYFLAKSNQDEALLGTVIQRLGLTEDYQESIFRKFGVLVFDFEAPEDISFLETTLEKLPSYILDGITSISHSSHYLSLTGSSGGKYCGTAYATGEINIYRMTNDIILPDNIIFRENILLHEIGHTVHWLLLSPTEWAYFSKLYEESSQRNTEDFAREYGKPKAIEDFATIFEAYTTDTKGIVAKAKASAAQGKTILLDKLKIVASLFKTPNNTMHVYSRDNLGNTVISENKIGRDGIPDFNLAVEVQTVANPAVLPVSPDPYLSNAWQEEDISVNVKTINQTSTKPISRTEPVSLVAQKTNTQPAVEPQDNAVHASVSPAALKYLELQHGEDIVE